MKIVGDSDITLSERDRMIIDKITDIRHFDIKKLIRFTNRLLLNQQTILNNAFRDRDFIDKSRKFRDAIIELNKLIVSGENVDTLLRHLLSTAIEIITDCDAGLILQSSDDPGKMKLTASYGFNESVIRENEFLLENTYLSRLGKLEQPEPVIIRNRRKFDEEYHSSEEMKHLEEIGNYRYPAVLTSPIIVDDSLYGIVSLNSRKEDGFTKDDIQLMKYFTSEMGVVIQNSILIQRALYLSRYDSLTGVHNRSFFEDVAQLVLEDAGRYNRKIFFVLFDLDEFKTINDTYGHEAGDTVLKVFADTVSSSIRGSDIFARYGGDEFIALFHDCDREGLENRIHSIITKLSQVPVKLGNSEYFIKYSFGIAGFPEDADSYEAILRITDKNMYKNKAENKNELS